MSENINRPKADGHAALENDFPTTLAKPALRALAGAGYSRLEQVAKLSEAELLELHGMGPKALEQLRLALAASGQTFKKGI